MFCILSNYIYLVDKWYYKGLNSEDRTFSIQLKILPFDVRIYIHEFINISIKDSYNMSQIMTSQELTAINNRLLSYFFGYFRDDPNRKIFMILSNCHLISRCRVYHCYECFLYHKEGIIRCPLLSTLVTNITLQLYHLKEGYVLHLLKHTKKLTLLNCTIESDKKLLEFVSLSKNYVCKKPEDFYSRHEFQNKDLNISKCDRIRISLYHVPVDIKWGHEFLENIKDEVENYVSVYNQLQIRNQITHELEGPIDKNEYVALLKNFGKLINIKDFIPKKVGEFGVIINVKENKMLFDFIHMTISKEKLFMSQIWVKIYIGGDKYISVDEFDNVIKLIEYIKNENKYF